MALGKARVQNLLLKEEQADQEGGGSGFREIKSGNQTCPSAGARSLKTVVSKKKEALTLSAGKHVAAQDSRAFLLRGRPGSRDCGKE